jgi:hypothetical protein
MNTRQTLKSLATQTTRLVGGELISQREYNELQHQKFTLLEQAARLYRPNLNQKECVGIVFSFNRPVQLQACLASYFHHVANPSPLIVQYRARGDHAKVFKQAYQEIAEEFSDHPVEFIEEDDCRSTLLKILQETNAGKIFFLVDDILFIRPVDMAQFTAVDPLKYVACLRMSPRLNFCYTLQEPTPAPELSENKEHGMLQWNWGDSKNEWSYPCSVDGNLFDTAEILMMSLSSPFKAPNSYEGALHSFAPALFDRPGLCYSESIILNIPCNKVQEENDNIAGLETALTPEGFLTRWNNGECIDWMRLENFENTAPHQEVAIPFTKRAGKKAAA